MDDQFLTALEQAARTVVARVRGELPATDAAEAVRAAGGIAHVLCCERTLCGSTGGAPGPGAVVQDCVVCADLGRDGGACVLCAGGQSAV
ncbi:hypothetical protein ACWD4V_01090 [Streptomyces tsukubensis]